MQDGVGASARASVVRHATLSAAEALGHHVEWLLDGLGAMQAMRACAEGADVVHESSHLCTRRSRGIADANNRADMQSIRHRAY